MESFKNKYPLVSVFKNVTDTSPIEQKQLIEILNQINNCVEAHIIKPCRQLYKEGKFEEYSEKKKSLKCFTASGMFENGRKAENLKDYSGFIILDIDKLPEEQVKPLKERISAMRLTFACFISPSGCGLKILVKVTTNQEKHTQAFNQLKAIYEKELNVEIDKSGKDINRLCFYSSDSEIYINENSLSYTLTHEPPVSNNQQLHANLNTSKFNTDVFEKCVQLTENIYQYSEGQRNNFVHLLANNCNRNGISELDATQKIKAHFNYDDSEVSASIKSAYSNGKHEAGKFVKPKLAPTSVPLYAHKGVVKLGALIQRLNTEPAIPFIWSGIKKNSFGFVFGPSKSGKTTFCENLAMCLAAQLQQFFGKPITPDDYNVLFISLEEYWQNRTERNQRQASILNENLGHSDWLDKYMVINEFVPRQLATDEDWLDIERMIVINKANVVFIDSLSRLYEGGIENSELAKKVALRLRELTNKLGITLIVIHHTTKQLGKPITQDSIAGSRILLQEADFILGISKNLDNKRYFKEVAFRYRQEQQDSVTTFEIDAFQWLIPGAELPESALLKESDGRKDDSNPEQVYEFIRDKTLSEQGETYTRELIAEFVTSKIMSKQTLYNCLDRLERDNKISKRGKGVYKSISE